MSKDHEELKRLLADFAPIVNSFSSESVQLKVVEALLAAIGPPAKSNTPKHEPDITDAPTPKARPRARSTGKGKVAEGDDRSKPARNSGKSPKAACIDLLGGGFFADKKGIKEVQAYLSEKKAKNFSVSSLQTALNRLVHNSELQRSRNDETKQFEYYK